MLFDFFQVRLLCCASLCRSYCSDAQDRRAQDANGCALEVVCPCCALRLLPPHSRSIPSRVPQEIMDHVVLYARRSGIYDDGIVDMKGTVKAVGTSTIVYRDLFSQVREGVGGRLLYE